MRYLRPVCLLFVLSGMIFSLYGRSVDIQRRRLEYIQGLIDQKQVVIEETRKQKKEFSQRKEHFESELEECIMRMDELSQEEMQLVEDLIRKEHEKENTERRLAFVLEGLRKQVTGLYINHLTEKDFHTKAFEAAVFPVIISKTNAVLGEHDSHLTAVIEKLQEGRTVRDEIAAARETEQLTGQTISTRITGLYAVIDSLSAEEIAYSEDVRNLEKNRLALESLIEHLQSEEFKASYQFTNEKLLWPVKGEVQSIFGQQADDTYNFVIINNGIDIVSKNQQEVKAVDFGIVVFAESFRNYGRMVIIDHRNGYHSLYANNANLIVTKGDVVSLGEAIAVTGKKSGDESYLLYFELRRENKPVNPLHYLE